MEFIEPALAEYAEAHSTAETELLAYINRETHLKINQPRMLSGHLQGNVLQTFARMMRPRRILEIGTYTGYSAICMAQGLSEDGILHTIDNNEELEPFVREAFQKANLEDKIHFHLGNAIDIIPTIEETFDMVFIDADKENYSAYYDLVWNKLRSGGLIIADNVLWSGKVLNPKNNDKSTQALMEFNQKVHQDNRAFNTLMPIRDGLMLAVKS
ncbi:MAG: O-methyltransferase [Bernardetiaceae bacterium]|nr:O-methyltransferase [Bernardetiaceae bacterium]